MINTLKFAAKAAGSNFADPQLPYKLTMVLTGRCNNRCKSCNIWQNQNANDSLIEDIERFFKKSNFFSWISLTGGEIFLRNDVFSVCKIIKDNVKDVCFLTFPTNGYLTEKILADVDRILGLNFNKVVVSVSLDGPLDMHNTLRGVDGSWDRALKTFCGLKAVKNRRFAVNFGFTISNYNMRSIGKTIESIKAAYPKFSLKDLHLNLAFNAERYSNMDNKGILCTDSDGLISELTTYQENKKLLDPISVIDYLHVKFLKRYIKSGRTPLPCMSLASSCLVDVDWNVYPCFNFNVKAGNLKENDFDLAKLWASGIRRAVRARVKAGDCPHCRTPCESFQTILGNMPRAFFSKRA